MTKEYDVWFDVLIPGARGGWDLYATADTRSEAKSIARRELSGTESKVVRRMGNAFGR